MTHSLGLSGTRLPVHPQPLPDELLTHWFMRLAHANQVKAQTLADRMFGQQSAFWARDQDKLASQIVVSRLSDFTGKSPDDIRGLTLATLEGSLYQRHNSSGNTRWVLPVGVYHRTRRRYGMQFCPLCLATDQVPYFRRVWRLALTTVCECHGILMHDRCHRCSSPVAFHRGELGRREKLQFEPSALCHFCGCDLSRAPAFDPSDGSIHPILQLRSLVTFQYLGWTFCGNETYQYGHLFFDVLHRLCNILASHKGKKLLSIVAEESQLRFISTGNGWHEFEFRPLRERHFLLLAALWLLLDWPDRFVQTCYRAQVTKSRILSGWKSPYWFARVVQDYLDRSGYMPTAEEANNAAAYLERIQHKVTGKAVGRLIGSRDIEATKPYKKRKQWPMTKEGVERLFADIEQTIRSKPRGSRTRLLLERDRAFFWFMRLAGMSMQKVRALTVEEALYIAKKCRTACPKNSKLERIVSSYLRDVRPNFVKKNGSPILFLAANGSGMSAEAVRQRLIARLNSGNASQINIPRIEFEIK